MASRASLLFPKRASDSIVQLRRPCEVRAAAGLPARAVDPGALFVLPLTYLRRTARWNQMASMASMTKWQKLSELPGYLFKSSLQLGWLGSGL